VPNRLNQINHPACDRGSGLILVDADPANLLSGRVDAIAVSRQVRRQISIRKINNQPRWIVQCADRGNKRAAGQDFHRRPRQHAHAANEDRRLRSCQQFWSRLGSARGNQQSCEQCKRNERAPNAWLGLHRRIEYLLQRYHWPAIERSLVASTKVIRDDLVPVAQELARLRIREGASWREDSSLREREVFERTQLFGRARGSLVPQNPKKGRGFSP
jgi:hypothetical protein